MKFPFFSPPSVTHEVEGVSYEFYGTRTYLVGKLRGFLKPVFKAIAVLTTEVNTDVTRNQTESKGSEGEYQVVTSFGALDPSLAKMRSDQREAAIESLVDNLMNEASLRSVALLVLDSLRNDVPGKPTSQEIDEFVENTPLSALVQLVTGVAKANKGVFGPLTKRVEMAFSILKSRLEDVVDKDQPSKQPEESEEMPPTPSGPVSSDL